MHDARSERRRENRFAIGAQAVLRNLDGGEAYPAVTVNISPGGLLLKLTAGNPFEVGQAVVCEIAVHDSAEPFVSWGVGRVIRVDRMNAAVELKSGVFPPQDSGSS